MGKPGRPGQTPAATRQHTPTRTLWGRLLRRAPSRGERKAPPVVSAPTRRALTVTDALWTVDTTNGRRVYVPLVVVGVAGTWAGREWLHCGATEGVLLARWVDRDYLGAPLRWQPLAGGAVMVIEGGQQG